MNSANYQRLVLNDRFTFYLPTTGSAGETVRRSQDAMKESREAFPSPPVLDVASEMLQPIAAPGSRLGEAFAVPAELAKEVTDKTPIRVELSSSMEGLRGALGVVPIIFDGEFYHLAGPVVRLDGQTAEQRSQGKLTVSINHVPEQSPIVVEAEKRINVFLAVKLGFFKLVGIPTSQVGLRAPKLERGNVTYQPVREGELSSGKTALLVHGFLSDTGWMVQDLYETLRKNGYQNVVTWDYETFTSPVRDTAAGLVKALETAGMQPQAQRLDVIAHSMGCLVTRSLLAGDPSLKLLRRALLMGPPNAGTPIANTPDFLTRIASSFINVSVATIPVRSIVRWLWERVDEGCDDLQPESQLIKWINRNPQQQIAPITMLMGYASESDHLWPLLHRVLQRGSTAYYGGPNDLVVPVASMKAIETFPNVTTESFTCNHFNYLDSGQASRDSVNKWIENAGEM